MSAIWHAMGGVLEHARTVAERKEMPHSQFRYAVSPARGDDRINWNQFSGPSVLARCLKNRNIAHCRLRPSHRSAGRVGTLTRSVTADVVCQQAGDFAAHRFSIPERNQNAT